MIQNNRLRNYVDTDEESWSVFTRRQRSTNFQIQLGGGRFRRPKWTIRNVYSCTGEYGFIHLVHYGKNLLRPTVTDSDIYKKFVNLDILTSFTGRSPHRVSGATLKIFMQNYRIECPFDCYIGNTIADHYQHNASRNLKSLSYWRHKYR